MRASGGTIFGNCAIGRLTSATAPTITVMIAMTIATMGRLMKNFDTARLLCGLARRRRDGIHKRAVLRHFLGAVRDDPVARVEPGLDHRQRADLGPDLHVDEV